MIRSQAILRPASALASLIFALPLCARAQQPASTPTLPNREASEIALPLGEDRGLAALEQALRRLGTTASVLAIVAHPDDEDGGLLTYLARGMGARVTLLTLTRGEGGQNAMGSETYDALGLMRTNELLRADEFYGVKQLWGTEADFGFSKTQEEAFARWGHDRVLYDAVLAVRRERPQIILSTFVGGVSDGHGHHQVAGEIAQEAFKAAADPKVFPDQLKDGIQPWQASAVYSMVPFAQITAKGIFDYATGNWAPARFRNYVTGEWIENGLSTDATMEVGARDEVLGRSYVQIAREGWGEQKSQYGGANPALSGPVAANYHLWAVADPARTPSPNPNPALTDIFHNRRVTIGTGIEGLAKLAGAQPPDWLTAGLHQIAVGLKDFAIARKGQAGTPAAKALAPAYRQTLALRDRVAASDLDPAAKAGLLLELDAKIAQFQSALQSLLGLDLTAFVAKPGQPASGPLARGASADEMPRSVVPGQEFLVRVHVTHENTASPLARVWLQSQGAAADPAWRLEDTSGPIDDQTAVTDRTFKVSIPENAEPTKPYFTRPSIEQPFYDLAHPEFRGRSFAPYPLAAWAEFTFEGLPIRVGQAVQTLARVQGQGGVYQPLVVTPAIGLSMEPEARILPLDGSALPVRVTVRAQAAAAGTVTLKLPAGWRAEPAEAAFKLATAADKQTLLFSVSPSAQAAPSSASFSILAVAHSAGHDYQTGWQSIGYTGMRPYNLYTPAQLKTRRVDVKLAPGLRVAYVMGTGDVVPNALEAMGIAPHLLTAAELASGDLARWNVIVIGIRAYSNRAELTAAQPRLNEFVRQGGTMIVQYQSADFPAPLPLALGKSPERVVDEQSPVAILDPKNPLLAWPNEITGYDFEGWVEERGHSFLASWDPAYAAPFATADEGQAPQRGGLVVGHFGKGTYAYVAFALYRQLPELVPGSYRLLANLLSAGAKGPRD